MRFAIGLAAGLILGLSLHFAAVWSSKAPMQGPGIEREVAKESVPVSEGLRGVQPVKVGGSRPVTGEVDWYVFTGPSGEKWLVEGVREGLVKTADYRGKPRPM
jgi:hypothetical protein